MCRMFCFVRCLCALFLGCVIFISFRLGFELICNKEPSFSEENSESIMQLGTLAFDDPKRIAV